MISLQEYLLQRCTSDPEYHCWNSGGKLIIQSWSHDGIYSVGNLNEEGLFGVLVCLFVLAFLSLGSKYLKSQKSLCL